MPVSYEALMALAHRDLEVDYTDKDTILYALSVGAGMKGVDEACLPFVYEGRPMRTLASMATLLMRAPVLASGLDMRGVLHGEQRVTLHRALPPQGRLLVDAGVSQVIDKGAEKGAVVVFESKARLPSGEPVFTTETVILARRDGGLGGPPGRLPEPHPMPQRAPDLTVPIETRPDQALLYRLNEDRNPLHVDPELARRAGFPAPILHGLCTYGLACHALTASVCGHGDSRITSFDARFASPVFPGELIELDAWVDGSSVSFRCRVPSRQVVVLDHGRCLLDPSSGISTITNPPADPAR